MNKKEIKALAKRRGVTPDTVKRWIRERGEEYAKTYLPISKEEARKKARGDNSTTFLFNEKQKIKYERTAEADAWLKRRQACETIEMAKELSKELDEVWE